MLMFVVCVLYVTDAVVVLPPCTCASTKGCLGFTRLDEERGRAAPTAAAGAATTLTLGRAGAAALIPDAGRLVEGSDTVLTWREWACEREAAAAAAADMLDWRE